MIGSPVNFVCKNIYDEASCVQTIRSNDAYDREYAAKLLRNNLDEYKSYLQEFQETAPEDNLPKLQVFPDCTELRNCIPSASMIRKVINI